MLADEDSDGLVPVDRLFERQNPPEVRAKRVAVEEGAKAFRAKPAVQLRSGGFVAARVAYENVRAVASRDHGRTSPKRKPSLCTATLLRLDVIRSTTCACDPTHP